VDYSKFFILNSICVSQMVPAVCKFSVGVVSHLTSIPVFLDGYFWFCLMYLFSSLLYVFVLGIYIHFLNFYYIVSCYLLLTNT
jgi:hypothetical protein